MKKIYIYISICFLSFSCIHSNKKVENKFSRINSPITNNFVIVDIDKNNKNIIKLSTVFSKVKTIILETNKNALIGSISSVQIYNDSIFILDRMSANGIFLFNKKGKFLKRIGYVGQGPGEYMKPTDFTINKKKNLLYVIDSQSQKIITFDLKTCNYLSSIKLSDNRFKSYHIQCVNESLYADVYYFQKTDSAFLLQEINLSTGERGKKWLKTTLYNKGFTDRYFMGQGLFYDRLQNSPKFIQLFMDTIVSLSNSKLMSYIAIESSKLLTRDVLERIDGDNNQKMRKLVEMDYVYNINSFVSFKDIVFFNFSQKNEYKCCIYNTKKNEIMIGSGIIDDLVYNKSKVDFGIPPRFCTSSVDGVYSYINPKDMPKFLDFAQNGKLNMNLDKINEIKQLSIESNPIIFIYDK